MIARVAGAAIRAVIVAAMIAMPALLLPLGPRDFSHIVLLVAILAGLLTFMEYCAHFPSIVEFRDAPPFNRLRFAALFANVLLLTLISRGTQHPSLLTDYVTIAGTLLGQAIDMPFSPVRLVVSMLPDNTNTELIEIVRTAAGMSYLVSLVAMAVFIFHLRILRWPTRGRVFNVWVNLPLFDPSAGGDVVDRLKRDARVNIILGFLLPFLIPLVLKLASYFVTPLSLANPQTLIWTMTAWAFLPASMIMRGLALGKIAAMIQDKRQRTYAQRGPHMV